MMQRTLLATLVLAVGLLAQEGSDPFAGGDRLRRADSPRIREVLPTLALKGFIADKSGNAIALVEVDGKRTHLLRKDDTLTLSGGAILKVSALGTRGVEIEMAGRKVVLR
ncbi:MAG: hypothetical protein ACYTHK_08900 [Planctomycetota bacterium]|jgi:hypothetical protein